MRIGAAEELAVRTDALWMVDERAAFLRLDCMNA